MKIKSLLCLCFALLCCSVWGSAQVLQPMGNRGGAGGGSGAGSGMLNNPFSSQRSAGDSLSRPQKRVDVTISIYYRYLDGVRANKLDSSIDDFTHFLPLPADYVDLGNLGSPAQSLVYKPLMQPGFDPGFHALDVYRLDLDSTRYFNTTKPYTKLGYLIGAKQEQLIDVFHTQNPRENINFGFHYRKINAPGFFRNQNTDGDNYNLFTQIHSRDRRYRISVSFVGNKLKAGDNGGIQDPSYLSNPNYRDRRTIPVSLGGSSPFSYGFFTQPLATFSSINENDWLFSQQYNWGRGDTLKLNDTTYQYVFHPIFRIENTLRLTHLDDQYTDTLPNASNSYYFVHYGLDSSWQGRLSALQDWHGISEDLSLVQFPVLNSETQFIKAGATYSYDKGRFLEHSIQFSNLMGHFEYRNLTRNQKWDLDAYGSLYLLGNNFGDYTARASLSRYLNDKLGHVQLLFQNLNQTPSFVYRYFESSRFITSNPDLKKTNASLLQFSAHNDRAHYHLYVKYYLLAHYTYFDGYAKAAQYSGAFNLLQLLLNKEFRVGHIHLYTDLVFQQTDQAVPLHVPSLWTRDRLSYANTLFTNLILNTGLELNYHTAYHADAYSPVLQQFVSQDQYTSSWTIPSVAAFFNFRIKAFNAYVRAENLNTFMQPNLIAVPGYPYQGFAVRVGLQWTFVN